MANIRIKDLTPESSPKQDDIIPIDLAGTRGATVKAVVESGRPTASRSEAESGTDAHKAMTPLTTKQAIDAQVGAAYVPKTVSVIAGTGLSGGGNLSGNVTVSLNQTSINRLNKVDSVEEGATKNDTDERLRDRSTHTGEQGINTVSGLQDALDSKATLEQGKKADTALQAPGGQMGQILAKNSNGDNDVAWVSSEAATAVSYGPQDLTIAQQAQAKKNIAADIVFNSKEELETAEVSVNTHAIRLNGYDALGDGRGGLYINTDNGSTDAIVSGGATSRTWYRVLSEAIIYKKRVVKQLPFLWDGAPILSSPDYWYPQGMSYDDDGNLYIHYLSDNLNAVVIYDKLYNFISWFIVPSSLESIIAKGSLNKGTLKIYLRGVGGTLQEYDLTSLPINGGSVSPAKTVIPSNVGSQFTYSNGTWIIESIANDYGAMWSRTVYGVYNDEFKLTGTINIPKTVVGARNESADIYPYVPKSQGIAVKDGSLYIGVGGSYLPDRDPSPAPVVADVGYAKLSIDGMSILEYGVLKAEEFRIKLMELGYEAGRTESEGICVHPSGELHTLFVGGRPSSPTAEQSGLLIISEKDEAGTDYSDIKTNYIPVNLSNYESHFPRDSTGGLSNPLNGEPINNLSDVLDWLHDVNVLKGTSFYSGLVDLPLLEGMHPLSNTYRVDIESFNGIRFTVTLTGYGDPNSIVKYLVTGGRGAWEVGNVYSGEYNDVYIGKYQNNEDYYGRILCKEKVSGEPYNVIYAYGSSGSNNITIGGGTLAGNAANQIMFATAQTIGVNAGTIRWRINSSGNLRPETDNTYNFGAPSERVKDIYAANGTINTSDARLKTKVKPLTESEINAAKQLSKEIGVYKFLKSVEDKGDEARKHIGMTVQRAIEIMEDNGLNPMEYGFICYDEWDEVLAIYDDEGNEIEPYHAAGSIYSFRHDELLMFIARGFDARLTAMEDL